MAKVSAIVSAYFAADYIEGRIENLLAQDPKPEVIVICAAGSEEARIVACRKDVVAIYTPDNPTIYAAWNIAIQAATGDYVTNANSDDRLYPGALKLLARVLDESDAAVAYADTDIVREIGGDPVNRHEWIDGDFEILKQVCFIGPMPMWRRSLHQKYGYFDRTMKSAGDYEFWLRLASQGETFKHIPRAIGAYLKRRDSAERREPLRTLWETARARSRYAET